MIVLLIDWFNDAANLISSFLNSGIAESFRRKCEGLAKSIEITANEAQVPIQLGEESEGVIFSNIPSFGGGMKLWTIEHDNEDEQNGDEEKEGAVELKKEKTTDFQPDSIQDGLLELVTVNGSVHLGTIKMVKQRIN